VKFTDSIVSLFGDRVHITTSDPARVMSESDNVLKAAGIDVISIRKESPSLEDVFISIGRK